MTGARVPKYRELALRAHRNLDHDVAELEHCRNRRNLLLLFFFMELKDHLAAADGESHMQQAVRKAIGAIRDTPYRICTSESLLTVPFIGNALAKIVHSNLWKEYPPDAQTADELEQFLQFTQQAGKGKEKRSAKAAAAVSQRAAVVTQATNNAQRATHELAVQANNNNNNNNTSNNNGTGKASKGGKGSKSAKHAMKPGEEGGAPGQEGAEGGGKKRRKKDYIPSKGSANYAFMIVLYMERVRGKEHMGKDELMDATERSGLAHASVFGRGNAAAGLHDPRQFYSGWSSFQKLVNNDPPYAQKWSNPMKIRLTPEGERIAAQLYAHARTLDDVPALPSPAAALAGAVPSQTTAAVPQQMSTVAAMTSAVPLTAMTSAMATAVPLHAVTSAGLPQLAAPHLHGTAAAMLRAAALSQTSMLSSQHSMGSMAAASQLQVSQHANHASASQHGAAQQVNEGSVAMLSSMGFSRSHAMQALQRTGGNVEAAVELLTSHAADDDVMLTSHNYDDDIMPMHATLTDADITAHVVQPTAHAVHAVSSQPAQGATHGLSQQQAGTLQQAQRGSAVANKHSQSLHVAALPTTTMPSQQPAAQHALQLTSHAALPPKASASSQHSTASGTAAGGQHLSGMLDRGSWCIAMMDGGLCDDNVRLPPLHASQTFGDRYDIVLVVDQREQFSRYDGRGHQLNRVEALKEHMQRLQGRGFAAEVRHLAQGDAMWLARDRVAPHDEWVLDYIIERKRADDLVASIKGKRYEQQKFWIKRCGVRHPMYLVEGEVELVGGAPAAIKANKTATVATEVQDGFIVLRTAGMQETLRLYIKVTAALQRKYSPLASSSTSALHHCALPTFKQFSELLANSKRLTVRDVWGLMLTAVPGIGCEAAEVILALYPTPLSLHRAFHSAVANASNAGQHADAAAMALLASLQLPGRRKISQTAARHVYDLVFACAKS